MFSFPAQVLTNISYFTSKVFADTRKALSISHKLTPPCNLEANLTERVNSNLRTTLVANT